MPKLTDRQTDRQAYDNKTVLCTVVHHTVKITALITNKLHHLTERDSRLAQHFALLWGWGYVWAI